MEGREEEGAGGRAGLIDVETGGEEREGQDGQEVGCTFPCLLDEQTSYQPFVYNPDRSVQQPT